eukprot:3411743-Prymnesium_polylepis.2
MRGASRAYSHLATRGLPRRKPGGLNSGEASAAAFSRASVPMSTVTRPVQRREAKSRGVTCAKRSVEFEYHRCTDRRAPWRRRRRC